MTFAKRLLHLHLVFVHTMWFGRAKIILKPSTRFDPVVLLLSLCTVPHVIPNKKTKWMAKKCIITAYLHWHCRWYIYCISEARVKDIGFRWTPSQHRITLQKKKVTSWRVVCLYICKLNLTQNILHHKLSYN